MTVRKQFTQFKSKQVPMKRTMMQNFVIREETIVGCTYDVLSERVESSISKHDAKSFFFSGTITFIDLFHLPTIFYHFLFSVTSEENYRLISLADSALPLFLTTIAQRMSFARKHRHDYCT